MIQIDPTLYTMVLNTLLTLMVLVVPYSAIVHGLMGVRAPWEKR